MSVMELSDRASVTITHPGDVGDVSAPFPANIDKNQILFA